MRLFPSLSRLITAAPFLCFTGCYAYPKLAVTAPVPIAAPREEVRAFRVDVGTDIRVATPEVFKVRSRLTPLVASSTGRLESQFDCSLEAMWLGMLIGIQNEHSHALQVRLYRPGYQLREVHPWEWGRATAWKPVDGFAAQEVALIGLLGGSENCEERASVYSDLVVRLAPNTADPTKWVDKYGLPREPLPETLKAGPWVCALENLEPGSVSPGHREALLFVASECGRLEALAPDVAARTRMKVAGQIIREIAAR